MSKLPWRSILALAVLALLIAPAAGAKGGPPAHANGNGPPEDRGAQDNSGGPPDHAQGDPPAHQDDGHADGGTEEDATTPGTQDPAPSPPPQESTPDEPPASSPTADDDARVPTQDPSPVATDQAAATPTELPVTTVHLPQPETGPSGQLEATAPAASASAASTSQAPSGQDPAVTKAREVLETARSLGDPPTDSGTTGLVPNLSPSLAWGLPLVFIGGMAVALAAYLEHRRGPLYKRASAQHLRGREASSSPTPAGEQAAGEQQSEPASTSASGMTVPPGTGGGPKGILYVANEALSRGELEEAVSWFETAIALKPGLGVAHLCMGLCLSELDRPEEALDAFRAAIQVDEGDPVAVYQAARMLARLGRAQEAFEHLGPVLRALPEMAEEAREDEAFDALQDHPRFLALIGEL